MAAIHLCEFCPRDAVEQIGDTWMCENCLEDYEDEIAGHNPFADEPTDAVSE